MHWYPQLTQANSHLMLKQLKSLPLESMPFGNIHIFNGSNDDWSMEGLNPQHNRKGKWHFSLLSYCL